jgi:hypothetical protein
MSNPTVYFAWAQPAENSDPWAAAFDSLITAIDLTVHSIQQQPLPPFYTLVISLFAGAEIRQNVSPNGTGPWIPLSASPGGRYVGSFTVTNSGSAILFRLHATTYIQVGNNVTNIRLDQRLVVNPGSLTVPSGGWSRVVIGAGFNWDCHHSVAFPLAPGKYSVVPEARLEGTGPADQTSFMHWAEEFRIEAIEVRSSA